jgi:hypothetical protein
MESAKLQHLHVDPVIIKLFVMLKSMTFCPACFAAGYITWPRNAAVPHFPENKSNDGVKGQAVDKGLYHWR